MGEAKKKSKKKSASHGEAAQFDQQGMRIPETAEEKNKISRVLERARGQVHVYSHEEKYGKKEKLHPHPHHFMHRHEESDEEEEDNEEEEKEGEEGESKEEKTDEEIEEEKKEKKKNEPKQKKQAASEQEIEAMDTPTAYAKFKTTENGIQEV